MQEAEMARRQQEKETKERQKEIENFRVQEDKTKAEKDERKTGQKTWGNTDMESVQQDKERVQRKLEPAVPVLKARVIECKPRPKPDLIPEYGLEPKADPAPRPRAEKADMELLDIEDEECEDEELALMGNKKIMRSSDLEEAQHELQKEAKEARCRGLAEAIKKCYRHNGSSNISKEDSAPPMNVANSKTNGDMEGGTCSSNSNEADERITKVDSVTGKVIGWVNRKVKERNERKIARTYWREENQSDQLYINGVVVCSRAQREREKRAKLLKGEQTRRRLERRWQEWEKRYRRKNTLKRVQRNGLWYRELEDKDNSQGSHEDNSLPDGADEADGDEEVEYLLMYGPCDCELCRYGYTCLWYSYDKEETDPKEARSKRRRIINWINTRVKEDYRKRINTTFNIQSLVCNDYAIYGNAILRQWDLQKIIRRELVKKEERRQRLEKRWKEWEKARAQKIKTILQEKKAKEQVRLNRLIDLNLEADQKIKEFIAANPGIQSQYPGGHTRMEMMGRWDMGYQREETQGQEGRVWPATVQKSTAPLRTKKITKWQKLQKWFYMIQL
nr:trichohyalin-like [Oncorhynchus nerka]